MNFSSFARMPTPVLNIQNVAKYVEEALLLTKQAQDEVVLDIKNVAHNTMVNCDGQQIRQVMNNLLKNAIESIQMKNQNAEEAQQGEIDVLIVQHDKEELSISITDNGIGLPEDADIMKLTEPYITHQTQGNGAWVSYCEEDCRRSQWLTNHWCSRMVKGYGGMEQ